MAAKSPKKLTRGLPKSWFTRSAIKRANTLYRITAAMRPKTRVLEAKPYQSLPWGFEAI